MSYAWNKLRISIINITYGPGDGLTTFNIPNLEQRIPVGQGPNSGGYNLSVLGATSGSTTVTLTDANLPTHSHDLSATTFTGTTDTRGIHNHEIWADPGSGGSSGSISLGPDPGSWYDTGTNNPAGPPDDVYVKDAGAHSHNFSGILSGTTGDGSPALQGTAHGNMQPYVIMRYIIKL